MTEMHVQHAARRFVAERWRPGSERRVAVALFEIPAGRDSVEVNPAALPRCAGRIGEWVCFGRRNDAQEHGVTGRSSR
jgi:hypothetical protein